MWVSLYKHILHKTDIKVVSDCVDYRLMAKKLVRGSDAVLEIGCSTGLCTKILVKSAKQVVAIDISEELMEEIPGVRFMCVDVREIDTVRNLIPKPDVVFLDIGGDRSLNHVMSILRLYLLEFSPRLWVIRNFELAIVHSLISEVKIPIQNTRVKSTLGPKDLHVDSLLMLAKSDVASDRIFAARKLKHIDSPLVKQALAELALDSNSTVRRMLGEILP